MTETQQKSKGGRPRLAEEARRVPYSFRTTPETSDRYAAAAEASGRSLAQEVEYRLEQSLMRDKEAGSRDAVLLGEFVKLAAAMIEARTGKSWADDPDSYFQVSEAIQAFMQDNHPPSPEWAKRVEQAADDEQVAADALDALSKTFTGSLAAIAVGVPTDPEAYAKAHEEWAARRKVTQAAAIDARVAIAFNKEVGRTLAGKVGGVFKLRA